MFLSPDPETRALRDGGSIWNRRSRLKEKKKKNPKKLFSDFSFSTAPVMLIQKPTHRCADRTVSRRRRRNEQRLALPTLISSQLLSSFRRRSRTYHSLRACQRTLSAAGTVVVETSQEKVV